VWRVWPASGSLVTNVQMIWFALRTLRSLSTIE